VQSFSCPSPAGPMTVFYSLRFETPPTWKPGPRIYIPQGQGGPVKLPGTGFHWIPFLSPPTTRWDDVAIRPRLHTGFQFSNHSRITRINYMSIFYNFEANRIWITICKSSYIIACIFVVMNTGFRGPLSNSRLFRTYPLPQELVLLW
jgi:hypothetical protein